MNLKMIKNQDALFKIDLPNPQGLRQDVLELNYLSWLRESDNLSKTLEKIDHDNSIKRIYIMGCARSGTWLLTALLSTFDDLVIFPRELGVENFGLYSTTKSTLVIKRNNVAWNNIQNIPNEIQIVYIVRHPFDVLTSYNKTTNNKYHVDLGRWIDEVAALKILMKKKLLRFQIIRYEDLVKSPEAIQLKLAQTFQLNILYPPNNFVNTFKGPREAIRAMHSLRPFDEGSVDNYKKSSEKIEYLKGILSMAKSDLEWFAIEFAYDISL